MLVAWWSLSEVRFLFSSNSGAASQVPWKESEVESKEIQGMIMKAATKLDDQMAVPRVFDAQHLGCDSTKMPSCAQIYDGMLADVQVAHVLLVLEEYPSVINHRTCHEDH